MGKKTINDRVKQVRKAIGLTQQEFAEKLGHKTSNTLSMLERKKSQLTEYNIHSICTPNQLEIGKTVDENWLRTGQGEMFLTPPALPEGRPRLFENDTELPADEEELVGIYRQLTRPNKTVAVKQIDALLEGQDDPADIAAEKGDMRKLG